ncbi:MAG: hypothetical protein HYT61_00425 [Candidatus Yanofskybacteria bacterium]|nr:hypothetical protein [Candidatus Yanofskybacteria bacterium]
MAVKNKIFLFTCAAVLFVFILPLFVNADVVDSRENFVYLFHLYYDNGQLFADRDARFKYDIIAEPYVVPALKTASPYSGEILNFNNKILATFKFDQSIVKGRLSLKGPYFADASAVNFYNDVNQLLLTIDVSGSSFCNDDEVCNSDVGENSDNCSNDCKLKPPPVSTTPLPTAGGSNTKLMLMIVGAIAVIAVLVIWFIIKKRRGVGSGQLPTQMPPQAQ